MCKEKSAVSNGSAVEIAGDETAAPSSLSLALYSAASKSDVSPQPQLLKARVFRQLAPYLMVPIYNNRRQGPKGEAGPVFVELSLIRKREEGWVWT